MDYWHSRISCSCRRNGDSNHDGYPSARKITERSSFLEVVRNEIRSRGMRVAGSGLDSTAHSKPGQLMTILCKVDGLCESAFEGGPQNPGGVATYGYVICYEDGRLIAKGSGV